MIPNLKGVLTTTSAYTLNITPMSEVWLHLLGIQYLSFLKQQNIPSLFASILRWSITNQAKKKDDIFRKTEKMLKAEYAQKLPNAGSADVAPIPKAKKSVMEVIVIATPECFIANPILSSKGRL